MPTDSHMTKVEGVPDSSAAVPGMAYFPDTGPFGRTCGECIHRGYKRVSSKETFNERTQTWFAKTRSVTACAMFKRLAGCHGPAIDADNHACKYFEAKPEATQEPA